jgi:hypothetical protein
MKRAFSQLLGTPLIDLGLAFLGSGLNSLFAPPALSGPFNGK